MPKDLKKPKKSKEIEIPPPPDKPQQCHFFVLRKRRYCSLPAKKESKYCGEHLTSLPENQNSSRGKRIPCPYDTSHTIFEKDLELHMKNRCNARPRAPPPCFSLNVNCTLPLSAEELEFQKNIFSHQKIFSQPWIARVQLKDLSKNELDQLIEKVTHSHRNTVPEIPVEILTHPSAEKKRPYITVSKQLDQLSSLLGHMEKGNMLQDKGACFVEFGAGRGDLSMSLRKAIDDEEGQSTFLLLDRKNVRNKVDQSLQGFSEKPPVVQRVVIDIKDLDLSKVECILRRDDTRKKVVVLSKHLCGSATDITLKCLMNYVQAEKALGNSNPVSGIVIALCCHQLCRYEMYPNTEYLESLQVTKLEFDRICKMSSWAICSVKSQSQKIEQNSEENEDHADNVEEDNDQTNQHFSGRDFHERENIGYQCKRLLDVGRLQFLEKNGFKTRLVYYVNSETSLENCALIAVANDS